MVQSHVSYRWTTSQAGRPVSVADAPPDFNEQNELNRYYSDFNLDGDYCSSPGTDWRANASYGFGYSDSSRILVEQGVLLPLARSSSNAS
jgi:hypothetical protein